MVFPGKFHTPKKTIFDQLTENGFTVASDFYPYFIFFDFESILIPTSDRTPKVKMLNTHKPISVSIASNVPGYETPKHFLNSDESQLIKSMIEYMTIIGLEAYSLMRICYLQTFQEIKDELIANAKNKKDNDENDDEESSSTPVDDDDDDNETSKDSQDETKNRSKLLSKLRCKLVQYCYQIPVLGFNSSKYDINLIKHKLIEELILHSESYDEIPDPTSNSVPKFHSPRKPNSESTSNMVDVDDDDDVDDVVVDEYSIKLNTSLFVIKKNNQYLCISSTMFKFLDILNYLSPGYSYASFLNAYNVTESKSFFPYDFFDSIGKLDHSALPPIKSFYSSLKGKNVLGEGEEAVENYKKLQQIWKDYKMETF